MAAIPLTPAPAGPRPSMMSGALTSTARSAGTAQPVSVRGKSIGRSGLLQIVSNSELLAAENAAANEEQSRREAEKRQYEPEVGSLAHHVRRAWESAREAKQPIQRRMLASLRQRRGEYDADKLAEIKGQGGSEIFMQLTSVKCVAAEAWIRSILQPVEGKPWGLKPTPVPDLPPVARMAVVQKVVAEAAAVSMSLGVPVTQEQMRARAEDVAEEVRKELDLMAQEASDRMEVLIQDQFIEGGWYKALGEMVSEIVTYPNAFLRGPVNRNRQRLVWTMQLNGKWQPWLRNVVRPEYYRPSPLDIYPSPDSTGIDDGDLIEIHRLRRRALLAMKGVAGYDAGAIDGVLEDYGRGGLTEWLWDEQDRAELENRQNETFRPGVNRVIEAIEFNGSAPGSLLREWGVKGIEKDSAEYEINAWVIGRWVIKAVLQSDPLGRRNYYTASYETIPGSFWGRSVPEKMRDVQVICNAISRAIVNNVGMSSGPQIEIFEDRLLPEEDIKLFPWKVWQTKSDPTGGGHKAVNMTNVQMTAQHLMRLYDYFMHLADDHSGVPAYEHGQTDVGGAGRTASGLSMLMTNASKGIRHVIGHLDEGVIVTSVERQYEYNMLRSQDESVKGDLEAYATGTQNLVAKEQAQVRQTEFLQATANPIDMQILGVEGRAELLREVVKNLNLPTSKIVPDRKELERRIMQEAQAAIEAEMGGGEPGGPPGGGPPGGGAPPPQGRNAAPPARTNQAGDKTRTDFNAFPNRPRPRPASRGGGRIAAIPT